MKGDYSDVYKFAQRTREEAGRSLLLPNYAFRYAIIQHKNVVFRTFYHINR